MYKKCRCKYKSQYMIKHNKHIKREKRSVGRDKQKHMLPCFLFNNRDEASDLHAEKFPTAWDSRSVA